MKFNLKRTSQAIGLSSLVGLSAGMGGCEALAIAYAGEQIAQGQRDAARIRLNENNNTSENIVYPSFSYSKWVDFNGDGYVELNEFVDRGKNIIRVGEKLYFILYTAGSNQGNSMVSKKIYNGKGKEIYSLNNHYNIRNNSPTIEWIAEDGEEGDYIILWGINGKNISSNSFTIISK